MTGPPNPAVVPGATHRPGGRRWSQEHQQHPDRERDYGNSTRHRNQRDEVSVIREVFGQAQALTSLGDRPLAVLTVSVTTRTEGWVSAQDQRALGQLRASHRALQPGGPARGRQSTSASVHAITEVITSVRTHVPLPGR